MNILIIDNDKVGLPFAMRCLDAGHEVKLWTPPSTIGEGLVEKVKDWKREIGKADLIFVTDNSKLIKELEPYHKTYPIFGPNARGAQLELDREAGQDLFKLCGIDVLPYEAFDNYDKAIAYVKKAGKPFVSKPWGGNPDKDLSYVPKTAEDLVCRLEHWKGMGVKGEFMLQEMCPGLEMAVGCWVGKGGVVSQWYCENWEEKRLMAGGLGPNTGEMGTVLRYVKRSKLYDETIRPCLSYLEDIGYIGYVDVNCMVDEDGTPYPLEFTMRPGWPLFNLQLALHQGDPAQWMLDLLNGRDTLKVDESICVGNVMALGDFPWDNLQPEQIEGWPIRGIGPKTVDQVYLTSARMGKAPVEVGGRIVDREVIVSAGSYVLVTAGLGKDVCEAREASLQICGAIHWPPHKMYRIDIGKRLEDDLPALQKLGYAKGLKYGDR